MVSKYALWYATNESSAHTNVSAVEKTTFNNTANLIMNYDDTEPLSAKKKDNKTNLLGESVHQQLAAAHSHWSAYFKWKGIQKKTLAIM